MKNKNKNNGFTLVEIMLAVAVLSIIVVSFSGAFSSGFRSIQQSRNEITDLNQSQTDLEEKIAGEAFDRAKTLNLYFNNQESIEVPGAIVEKNDVRTFLPDVPVIKSVELTPNTHIYGLEQDQWEIEINTRGVIDNSPITVSVYQQNDTDTVLISNTENEIVDESAEFSIDIPTERESRLTDDLYYFRFEVEGVNGELDKFYTVRAINYLALGESTGGDKKILASANHRQWGILEAENSGTGTIDFDNIKAGAWGGEVDDRKFVIVGNGGEAYSSNDGVYWEDIASDGKYDFKDVVWNGNVFLSAGQDSLTSKSFIIEYNSSGWGTNLIPNATMNSLEDDTLMNNFLFLENGIEESLSITLATGTLDNGTNNIFLYNVNDEWKSKKIGIVKDSNIIDTSYNQEDNKLFIIERVSTGVNLLNYELDYDTTSNEIDSSFESSTQKSFSLDLNNSLRFQGVKFVFGDLGNVKFYDSSDSQWYDFNELEIESGDPQIPDLPGSYSNFNAKESLAIENDLLILGEKDSSGMAISEMYLLEYDYETESFSWKSLSDLSLLNSDSNPLYDFENDFPYSIIDIISK
jgi:prepilin-type N-terminal cleavage/methylation domain-containing protein